MEDWKLRLEIWPWDKIFHALFQEKGDIPDKSLTESNRIGEESIKLILDNNLTGGVKRIAEAMSLNPHDHRHYLNRCYCYLRLSKYAQ